MEEEQKQQELKPHKYPIFIKILGILTLGIFFYSILLVPSYLHASKALKKAEQSIAQNNYTQAIADLKEVLIVDPNSEKAKIQLAIAYFSNKNPDDDEEGLSYLENMEISDADWQKVSAVMPENFKNFFETIKK